MGCKDSQREVWVLTQLSFNHSGMGGVCGEDGRESHEDYRTSRIFKIPDSSLQ